mmetsp:Transcript_36259/g.90660  ORF Transcript_36259/g.90660 Transcript_36259/m.90660 type:complete len:219 (+) Transcript_36259:404-1060(+)
MRGARLRLPFRAQGRQADLPSRLGVRRSSGGRRAWGGDHVGERQRRRSGGHRIAPRVRLLRQRVRCCSERSVRRAEHQLHHELRRALRPHAGGGRGARQAARRRARARCQGLPGRPLPGGSRLLRVQRRRHKGRRARPPGGCPGGRRGGCGGGTVVLHVLRRLEQQEFPARPHVELPGQRLQGWAAVKRLPLLSPGALAGERGKRRDRRDAGVDPLEG